LPSGLAQDGMQSCSSWATWQQALLLPLPSPPHAWPLLLLATTQPPGGGKAPAPPDCCDDACATAGAPLRLLLVLVVDVRPLPDCVVVVACA